MYSDAMFARQGWVRAFNNSGFVIPAYGCAKIVTVDVDGIIELARPSDVSADLCVLVGPSGIALDGYGDIATNYPAYAAYDSGGATPSIGTKLIPVVDSFELIVGNGSRSQFPSLGGSDDDVVMVNFPYCSG